MAHFTWRTCRFAPVLIAVLWGEAAHAQPYTGQQLFEGANRSIDVLKDHVQFLSVQDRYDAALGYLVYTHRAAPVRLALNDGRTPRGVIQRGGVMTGLGFGSPRRFSLFGGAWIDIVQASAGEGFQPSGGGEGILFLGAGFAGFQLTYGSFQHHDLPQRDAFGNFATEPDGGGAGTSEDSKPWLQQFVTMYHETGASLVVTWSKVTGETRLTEVRAQLQPLRRWLDREAGLPMVAVQRWSELKDNYGDYSSPSTDTGTLASAPDEGTPYEVELGSDDLLGIGLRAHAFTQIAPKVVFRRFEAAIYRDVGKLTLAGRTTGFYRDQRIEGSVDLQGLVRVNGDPKPGKVGWPISVGAAYSYNTPDGSTFLPLPRAHVFGGQFILGVPDIAKSVVPIIRAKEEKQRK
ncbi:MAG: hypothetical protein HYZ29_29990 [Myxococcales bacterium]|nr:hypothetical protein [Myxococcales bacterium]